MNVTSTELPNGLRVVCERLDHVRSVALGLWVAAGSRDEPAGAAGVAHFLEHLVFKGTRRRSAREIAEFADAAGGNLNAYTAREYTCYYDKVLDEQFAASLDVLADMVCEPRLDPADFEKERQVILDELRLLDDTPEDLVQDLFFQALWGSHPVGRPVAGHLRTVQALSVAELRAFHARHYTARDMVVAVAGHVDPDAVLAEAERRLGGVPAGGGRPPRRPPAPHATLRPRAKRTEQVHVCVGCAAPALGDDAAWPAMLLANVLGGGTSSRLFQSIREERGLVYDVGAFFAPQTDSGAFAISLAAGPAAVGEAMRLVAGEVRRLQQERVAAAELARHKAQFRRALWLGLEGTHSRMSRLGRALVLGQPLLSPDEVVARVEAVDAEAVRDAAQALGELTGWAGAAVGPGAVVRSVWPALRDAAAGGRQP